MKRKRLLFFVLFIAIMGGMIKTFLLLGPFWRTMLVAFLVNQLAISSTTVYMHRSETHGAVKFKKAIEVLFRFAFWLTTGQIKLVWVVVHRRHHFYTEQELDPHSPVIEGWPAIEFGNVPRYRRAGRDPETLRRFSHGVTHDRWDKFIFDHGTTGLVLGVVILCCLLGFWWGLLAGLLHMLFYIYLETSPVNAVCHIPSAPLNYQIKPVVEHAKTVWNNWGVAILTWGEGFHYSHHEQQDSAKFGRFWWEFDFGWWLILVLEKLGWTTKVRRPHVSRAMAA